MNHLADNIINEKVEVLAPQPDEHTLIGYLKRHYNEYPNINYIYPTSPKLNIISRQRMRETLNAIQQDFNDGKIKGDEALVKALLLIDDYFRTLDAEEVKYLDTLALESVRSDLHIDE